MPLDARAAGPLQIGEYDVLAKIAEGGMGAVYKGRHISTGQLVAIKVLPPTTARNPVLMKRFEQEYRAALALDHPHIVKAVEFNGTSSSPFLVMEFVDGESLGAKVDRDGPMPEDEAIRIIAQVCQGLHKAHKHKLVHRDVKPDNILVTAEGVAKLTDLGLVKDAENELNLTRTGRGLGTPNYMAPEQFRDAKNADVRCDIYSLGATLYTLLTAETPFGKVGPLDCWMRKQRNDLPSPRELNATVSERVSWAVMRAMSGDPGKRPSSCKEFVEDLTGVSIRPPVDASNAPVKDLWYLVYRDDEGEQHTVKGTTDAIRKALKEGLLGDASNVRAGRTKTGAFHGLSQYPEFRDLVISAAPMPPPASPSGQAMRQTPVPRSPTPFPVPPSPLPIATPISYRDDPEEVEYQPAEPQYAPYDPTEDYRPVGESTTRPLIPIARTRTAEDESKKRVDWFLWGGVLIVALATSMVAVFVVPRLLKP
jgi:serine/threonine protein kinase